MYSINIYLVNKGVLNVQDILECSYHIQQNILTPQSFHAESSFCSANPLSQGPMVRVTNQNNNLPPFANNTLLNRHMVSFWTIICEVACTDWLLRIILHLGRNTGIDICLFTTCYPIFMEHLGLWNLFCCPEGNQQRKPSANN